MMNGKQTCGSLNDFKAICPHCGKKNFVSSKSSILQMYKEEKKILGLSCWKCRLDIDCDLSEEKEWYGCRPENSKDKQYELVYLPYNGEDMENLRKKFPTARFSDASDYIHKERFNIEVEDISKKEFMKGLIQTGIWEECLGLRLEMGIGGSIKDLLKEVLEELKAEHDPCIKKECWK